MTKSHKLHLKSVFEVLAIIVIALLIGGIVKVSFGIVGVVVYYVLAVASCIAWMLFTAPLKCDHCGFEAKGKPHHCPNCGVETFYGRTRKRGHCS